MSLQWDPESTVGFWTIDGQITDVTVLDQDMDPNRVLDPALPFTLNISWEVTGTLANLWLAAMEANWLVTAYAESMGPGPEVQIATQSVPKGAPGTTTWTTTLTVPAGTLPEDSPSDSGIYKLVVAVFINSAVPGPYDMSGFMEGPLIRMESHD